ncbi:hypothetical protein ZIOFF_051097 [Zingiber officinale]|uniref:PCI domain-containing protein n=1 Tax=Zingiber officinale TaxID=94328 RepID=A0A8J5FM50_ZINOF|nr:hypothetical protein ZIOFF_051097 [Zingiber officinale]
MGIERKQSAFIDRFVRQAAELGAAESVANLVLEATSHPSLFAFAEILAIPNLSKLLASQYSSYLDVLLLFACGTWKIYQRHAHSLPVLLPDQVRKLKQISVLALIENEKELPYDQLMEELDVSNVQELEDFLIQECIHTGIVRGKLDQLRRCFKVQFASGRDLTAEHLANTIETSNSWYCSPFLKVSLSWFFPLLKPAFETDIVQTLTKLFHSCFVHLRQLGILQVSYIQTMMDGLKFGMERMRTALDESQGDGGGWNFKAKRLLSWSKFQFSQLTILLITS